jgi:hypothetical protein
MTAVHAAAGKVAISAIASMCPPYRRQRDAERGGDQAYDLTRSLLQVVGVGEQQGGHKVLQRGLGSG